MADTKKQKRVRYKTPKGVLIFPWLNRPDTKFKAEGEYRATLRLSEEAAAELDKVLKPLHAKAVEEAKKDPKKKGKKVKAFDYSTPVLDDNGDATGEVDFKFKMTAAGIKQSDGSKWSMKPDLFDSTGQPLAADVAIWGGTIARINFEVSLFDKPLGCGISLRLNAVQVIKLVSSSRDASTYGFGDESDGDDADAPASGDDSDAEGEEGGDGEF